jgi:hypothetical protein
MATSRTTIRATSPAAKTAKPEKKKAKSLTLLVTSALYRK